jgi:hypothetical protein
MESLDLKFLWGVITGSIGIAMMIIKFYDRKFDKLEGKIRDLTMEIDRKIEKQTDKLDNVMLMLGSVVKKRED